MSYEVQTCECGKTSAEAHAEKEQFWVYEGGASCAACLLGESEEE